MTLLKKYKIYLLVLVLAISGYFVFNSSDNTATNPTDQLAIITYKCPADYTNPEDLSQDEEYINDIAKFIADFSKQYPNATEEDLLAKRDKLFIERKCINHYLENKEDYPNWCPANKQEMDGFLDYLSKIEYEEAMIVLKDLTN